MIHNCTRAASAVLLACMAALLLAGCQGAAPIGQKPGDEMNPAMSAEQKALNAAHKKRADGDQPATPGP